jgi:hypothetical protein
MVGVKFHSGAAAFALRFPQRFVMLESWGYHEYER